MLSFTFTRSTYSPGKSLPLGSEIILIPNIWKSGVISYHLPLTKNQRYLIFLILLRSDKTKTKVQKIITLHWNTLTLNISSELQHSLSFFSFSHSDALVKMETLPSGSPDSHGLTYEAQYLPTLVCFQGKWVYFKGTCDICRGEKVSSAVH